MDKQAIRAELAADVLDYLATGRKVTVLPSPVYEPSRAVGFGRSAQWTMDTESMAETRAKRETCKPLHDINTTTTAPLTATDEAALLAALTYKHQPLDDIVVAAGVGVERKVRAGKYLTSVEGVERGMGGRLVRTTYRLTRPERLDECVALLTEDWQRADALLAHVGIAPTRTHRMRLGRVLGAAGAQSAQRQRGMHYRR